MDTLHIGCEDTLDVFLLGEKNAQGLYEIRCHGERNVDPMYHPRNCASYALTAEISTREGKQLWHERMGHANDKVISQLSKQQDRTGVNLSSTPDTVACGECVQAKLPASSMTKSLVPPDTKVGELVFSDICGNCPLLDTTMYYTSSPLQMLSANTCLSMRLRIRPMGQCLSFSRSITTGLQIICTSRSSVFIRIMAASMSTTL
jgi:hypothetical protein